MRVAYETKQMEDICKAFCTNQETAMNPLWWVWGLGAARFQQAVTLPGRSGGSHTPSPCWGWSGSTPLDALTLNKWWLRSRLGHCHELQCGGNSSPQECLRWGNLWEDRGIVSRPGCHWLSCVTGTLLHITISKRERDLYRSMPNVQHSTAL